nr:putative ribonuclease H-like domain-containing protein [Tanacetum cinerariifolium]
MLNGTFQHPLQLLLLVPLLVIQLLLMTNLEDTGIFDDAYDDRDEGAEAEYNNIETVEAMQEELLQFKLLNVWTLVDLSHGKKAIGTKWVFRNKRDQRGIVVRNKARLVAQGHRQEEGIDYDEVFASVSCIEAIRLFLAYSSFMDFTVYQIDVKSAFLYGTIEEEVYVSQPPGFVDPEFPDRVYKVEKALHGLHQAPRAWYETLSTYFLENRFRRGTIDKTLFIKQIKNDILFFQVYVNDIIFGSTKKSLSTEYEQLMHKRFQMSSMRELTFFLGLQVLWLQNQLLDYGYNFMQKKIHVDNESAIWVISSTQQMVINSSCLTDKKELAIPGKTATGKEFSNPLMAGSLPKTISAKQIHAIINGKAVVISESSVRSDLLFDDEDGGASMERAITTNANIETAHACDNILMTQTMGRMIEELDKDEDVNLVSEQGEVHEIAELSKNDDDDATLAETLLNIKRSTTKDKGKRIIQETELLKKIKKREMIQKLDKREEDVDKGDQNKEIDCNDPTMLRYHALHNRPFSKAKVRKNMCMYLKNQGGYKQSYFKGMKYEDIRPIFERVWDQVHTFIHKDSKIVKEVMKRYGFHLQQESSKKQKLDQQTEEEEDEVKAQVDSDQEVEEMKLYMRIFPDEEIVINAIPLATKPPMIVEYKIVKEGSINIYHIIRADGSTKRYTSMINLLENIDNEDLEAL